MIEEVSGIPIQAKGKEDLTNLPKKERRKERKKMAFGMFK